MDSEFKAFEKEIKGKIIWNEPMKNHTSYGIGGPALCLFYPANEEDLSKILTLAKSSSIPTFFAGSGSNLLVSDEGFQGFVISLSKTFKNLEINESNVYSECGVMMGHFVKKCVNAELTGVESLIGVPGTLGGALKMNAGAYGREISNFLIDMRIMTLQGKIKTVNKAKIKFNYRYSSIRNNEILISANFKFLKGSQEEIQKLKTKASANRKLTQPLRFRSAGSVFKNPPEKAAGMLIDKAGLKGTRVGDAEISTKHANFFLNHGKASSDDIAELIRIAKKAVWEKFQIQLELEIKTLGFGKNAFKI